MSDELPLPLAPRAAESVLLRAEPQRAAGRVWCTTAGRGQWGASYATAHPECQVTCQFLDLYPAELTRQSQANLANFHVLCAADPPAETIDLAALPLPAQGDGELARDWLQAAHQHLAPGGQLFAATDNPRDRWLREQVERLFERVHCESFAEGRLYRATRTGEPRKYKNYDAEFAFRDGDRLIQLTSRPGVFSHRKLDVGARALMEAIRIGESDRVLDLGCGSGAVAFAAAIRATRGYVEAIDSNPRAVQCAQLGAQRNGLTNVTVRLVADGSSSEPGSFDVVVGNPPYYSGGRIASIFVEGARAALRPGGRVWFVTKDPEALGQVMLDSFHEVMAESVRSYWVVSGIV